MVPGWLSCSRTMPRLARTQRFGRGLERVCVTWEAIDVGFAEVRLHREGDSTGLSRAPCQLDWSVEGACTDASGRESQPRRRESRQSTRTYGPQSPTGSNHSAMFLIFDPQPPPLRPGRPNSDGATGPQTATKAGAAPRAYSARSAAAVIGGRCAFRLSWVAGNGGLGVLLRRCGCRLRQEVARHGGSGSHCIWWCPVAVWRAEGTGDAAERGGRQERAAATGRQRARPAQAGRLDPVKKL